MSEYTDEAYLGAAIILFKKLKSPLFALKDRYVFRATGGAWISVTDEQLVAMMKDGGQIMAEERGWTVLPYWWSLQLPFAIFSAHTYRLYPSRGEATRHLQQGERIITADIATGAEIPA